MREDKKIRDFVDQKSKEKYEILSKLLMKWRMFPANNTLKIQRHNGEYVSYSGVKFEGSPKVVFRSFFDPYIEGFCIDIIKDSFKHLKERNLSIRLGRKATKGSLKQLVEKFYGEMYSVDKDLNIDQKKTSISKFIDAQVNSYFHEKFWTKERVWKTIIALLGIGGAVFVIKIAVQVVVVNYFNQ